MNTKAPIEIYLQVGGNADVPIEGPTWCEDRINDGDIEYVRADRYDRLERKYLKVCETLKHWQSPVCGMILFLILGILALT